MEFKVFFYFIRWFKKLCIIFGCIWKYKYGLVICLNFKKFKDRVWLIIFFWFIFFVFIEFVFLFSWIFILFILLSRVDRIFFCISRCDVLLDRLLMMEFISFKKMRVGVFVRVFWKICYRYKNIFLV